MTRVGTHIVPDEMLEAAIFDVDGTLINSMAAFYPEWNIVGKEVGFGETAMSEEEFYSFGGMPLPEIVKELHRRRLGSEATDEFVKNFIVKKKAVHKQRTVDLGPPKAIDPVVALARDYMAKGIPIIAATSGLRENVEHHISANGLTDVFPSERILCAADLPAGKGKPHPMIFQKAAEKCGADPTRCRAYEDAEAGFQSAYTAGCEVIDVRDLKGYPAPDALKHAMAIQRLHRPWLVDN